jgi:hypothetical protein
MRADFSAERVEQVQRRALRVPPQGFCLPAFVAMR